MKYAQALISIIFFLFAPAAIAGNYETCISGNFPNLCKHHLLTPEQAEKVQAAELRENYKTCISGNFPNLCKHHLLTPEQAEKVQAAELTENYKTCISGNFPNLCKHHLLTPEQAEKVQDAELAENYKTCISGNFPNLCKRHLLTSEQAEKVQAAELAENYKICISGNFPNLCKRHLLTPEQAEKVQAAELGGNSANVKKNTGAKQSKITIANKCNQNAKIWNNCTARYLYENGITYEGEWKDNKPHGRGKLIAPNGTFFKGNFLDGNPVGVGSLTLPGGEQKEVTWKQGRMFIDGEDVSSLLDTEADTEEKQLKSFVNSFEIEFFGSFLHSKKIPEVLFLFSEIKPKDNYWFQRALRKNDIDLVVLSSPGGAVDEGLMISDNIRERGINSFIPSKGLNEKGRCASACSFLFFAGNTRTSKGGLGVHQFYSQKNSEEENSIKSMETTQFTVSEIIGYLNKFETPPWVFEYMFATKDMYFFDNDELRRLEKPHQQKTQNLIKKANDFINQANSNFTK